MAGTQLEQVVDRGDVAVHREHGVGDHHLALRAWCGERGGQGLQVAVGVDGQLGAVGPRQPAPVDDRRVVELVGVDPHPRCAHGREQAEVGGVAGGEHHGRLGAPPGRRGRPRARGGRVGSPRPGGDAPDAGAPLLDGVDRGGDFTRRVDAEAEVVVRRERDDLHGRSPPAVRWVRRRRTSAAPAIAPRRGCAAFWPSTHVLPAAAHVRHPSSTASPSTSTMRSISSGVEVSSGIRTMTSPRGRSSTPRAHRRGADLAGPNAARRWGVPARRRS